jgi:hypothetical protein
MAQEYIEDFTNEEKNVNCFLQVFSGAVFFRPVAAHLFPESALM